MFEKYYPVEVVLTKNPDKDFYYMSHSKYFANSKLIGRIEFIKGLKSFSA